MKNFKLTVWYRFVWEDEMEKDFDIHYLQAITKKHAEVLVTEMYGSKYRPYKIEVEEIQTMTKEIMFKLTRPN
jgi:hypothetical protein